MSSAFRFNLYQSKILSSGNGLPIFVTNDFSSILSPGHLSCHMRNIFVACICLTLSQTTHFKTLPNLNGWQTAISNLIKTAEKSSKGYKTLWEMEKLLVTSNFSFSCSVFKRLWLRIRKN